MPMILDIQTLIVGGSGYLGGVLIRNALQTGTDIVATYFSRPEGDWSTVSWHYVDIRDRRSVLRLMTAIRPDVVVNVAYRQDDWRVTADGAAHVAVGAQQVGAHLIHVSSDVVFSGRTSPYAETAVPDPMTPYGAAKAAAEAAVVAVAPGAAVVRTSLILGDSRSQHERLVRDLAAGSPGVLFADELRCPVHISDLSSALLELAAVRRGGLFHVAGTDAISRYDLGCLIAQREGLDPAKLRPGRRADLDIPGPIDLRLDGKETQASLSTRIRGAREFLGSSLPQGT